MMPVRVLVIDDERQVHRFLRPALEGAGYAVEQAETGADGIRLFRSRAPALVLLDLGLPDMDGQEVLRVLRGSGTVPVIVISARDAEDQKVEALDAGADDFVEKPFGVAELLARLRAALRHAERGPSSERYESGPLIVDMARRIVTVDGARVALGPRKYALLSLLARNAGRVVTHRHLLAEIWGPAHLHDVQYLRVHVGQLRQQLGAAASLLTTEPGVGYRMREMGEQN